MTSQDKDNLPIEEQPKEAVEMKEPKLSVPDKILEKLGIIVPELTEEDTEIQIKKFMKICDQALKDLESTEKTAGFSSEEIDEGKAFFLKQKDQFITTMKERKETNRFIIKMWIIAGIIKLLDDPFFKVALAGTWLLLFARFLF